MSAFVEYLKRDRVQIQEQRDHHLRELAKAQTAVRDHVALIEDYAQTLRELDDAVVRLGYDLYA